MNLGRILEAILEKNQEESRKKFLAESKKILLKEHHLEFLEEPWWNPGRNLWSNYWHPCCELATLFLCSAKHQIFPWKTTKLFRPPYIKSFLLLLPSWWTSETPDVSRIHGKYIRSSIPLRCCCLPPLQPPPATHHSATTLPCRPTRTYHKQKQLLVAAAVCADHMLLLLPLPNIFAFKTPIIDN